MSDVGFFTMPQTSLLTVGRKVGSRAPVTASSFAIRDLAWPLTVVNPPPTQTTPSRTSRARTGRSVAIEKPGSTNPSATRTRPTLPVATPPTRLKAPPTWSQGPSWSSARTVLPASARQLRNSWPSSSRNAARFLRGTLSPVGLVAVVKAPPTTTVLPMTWVA